MMTSSKTLLPSQPFQWVTLSCYYCPLKFQFENFLRSKDKLSVSLRRRLSSVNLKNCCDHRSINKLPKTCKLCHTLWVDTPLIKNMKGSSISAT